MSLLLLYNGAAFVPPTDAITFKFNKSAKPSFEFTDTEVDFDFNLLTTFDFDEKE